MIVVDDLHIAGGNITFAKEALKGFVQTYLDPGDNSALVVTSGIGGDPDLDKDRVKLEAAIDQLNTHDTRPPKVHASDITPEQAEQILRGDINALNLVATTMTDEAGNQFEKKGGAAVAPSHLAMPGGGVDPGNPNLVAASQEATRTSRAVLAQALQYSVATLSTVEAVLRGVANLPGRKLCLLVSDGFLVGAGTEEERLRNVQALVDAATRSGAVVYALDAKGLVTSVRDSSTISGPGSKPDLQHATDRLAEQQLQTTLERVSRDTGGFLVHGTNDLEGGLHRMLQDNDTYYLMAYEPTNTKQDGKFRKIEVHVPQHRDYVVRARAGYFAPGAKKATRVGRSLTPSGMPPHLAANHVEAPEGPAQLFTPIRRYGATL